MRAANLAPLDADASATARLLDEIGIPFAAADARVLAAQQLEAEGRRREAAEHLEQALAFYRPVGATRSLRECERLLAAARLEVSS